LVFERFRRGRDIQHSGSGLGLSIVRAAAQRMNAENQTGRAFWAIVVSSGLHLGLIGWWQGPELVRPERNLRSGDVLPAPQAIQVRLVPRLDVSQHRAVAPPPQQTREAWQPDSRARRRSSSTFAGTAHVDTAPAATSGPASGVADPADVDAAADHSPEKATSGPLALDLPANWSGRASSFQWPLGSPGTARQRPTTGKGGGVAIQETRGPTGQWRATVTTPWGRYCMRERRSAGPYDARRDRGMDAVTCTDR
jgi:hypothetical protein